MVLTQPEFPWKHLHTLSLSIDPIELRLPAIRARLAAGEDPNELGGWKNPGIQRPLHFAIKDFALRDYRQLKKNLPVIELLLQYGADPRLRDEDPAVYSPIEELEAWFDDYHKDHSQWNTEDIELLPFYTVALQMMKDKAAELDAQDEATAEDDALKEDVFEQKKSNLRKSWLKKLKFFKIKKHPSADACRC